MAQGSGSARMQDSPTHMWAGYCSRWSCKATRSVERSGGWREEGSVAAMLAGVRLKSWRTVREERDIEPGGGEKKWNGMGLC